MPAVRRITLWMVVLPRIGKNYSLAAVVTGFQMKNLLRDAFPANSVLHASTLKEAASRSRLYVIFLTPRSGSTWLTELAKNSGVLGTPQEWFNDGWIYTEKPALGCLPPRLRGLADVNEYVDAIVDEGPGIAGLELSVFQALMLREMIDGPFDPRWLAATFYLRRRDLAAQAVSLYRSVASGRFHSYQIQPEAVQAFEAVEYDFDGLLKWLQFLIECEQRFDDLFRSCGLSPVPLYYEDFLKDPLGLLQQIAWRLGATTPQNLPPTSLTLMRDATSAAWRERFVKDIPESVRMSVDPNRLSPTM